MQFSFVVRGGGGGAGERPGGPQRALLVPADVGPIRSTREMSCSPAVANWSVAFQGASAASRRALRRLVSDADQLIDIDHVTSPSTPLV